MADKEYIERGALIEMCKRQIECEWNTLASPGTWAHAFEDFSDLVEQTPAADVVEVVRCKNCTACDHCYPAKALGEEAAVWWYCKLRKTYVKPYDFCSYGERKEQT